MHQVPDEHRTVADAFEATVRRHAAKECIRIPRRPERHYLPDGLSLTYGQVDEIASGLRERYRAAGYGHGHRVAISLENRPEFFFHWLALNGLGVSVAFGDAATMPVADGSAPPPGLAHDRSVAAIANAATERSRAAGISAGVATC